MPKQYETMRDAFAKDMSMKAAKTKAAKIYNSKHPKSPVTKEEKEFMSKMKGRKR